MSVVANENIDAVKLKKATDIILSLQEEMYSYIKNGSGPFLAAIYNDKGELISKESQ